MINNETSELLEFLKFIEEITKKTKFYDKDELKKQNAYKVSSNCWYDPLLSIQAYTFCHLFKKRSPLWKSKANIYVSHYRMKISPT